MLTAVSGPSAAVVELPGPDRVRAWPTLAWVIVGAPPTRWPPSTALAASGWKAGQPACAPGGPPPRLATVTPSALVRIARGAGGAPGTVAVHGEALTSATTPSTVSSPAAALGAVPVTTVLPRPSAVAESTVSAWTVMTSAPERAM